MLWIAAQILNFFLQHCLNLINSFIHKVSIQSNMVLMRKIKSKQNNRNIKVIKTIQWKFPACHRACITALSTLLPHWSETHWIKTYHLKIVKSWWTNQVIPSCSIRRRLTYWYRGLRIVIISVDMVWQIPKSMPRRLNYLMILPLQISMEL